MSKFIEFNKQKLVDVANESLVYGDKIKTDYVLMEIDGQTKRVEGYYYRNGVLVLTDLPVRPRND